MPTNSLNFQLPFFSSNFEGAAFGAAHQLCAGDQEQLAELSKAGEIWKNTASASSGELQFLMGHYTESDLRRLIAVAKALEAFKRLDQHDQERLLKGGSRFLLTLMALF
jgi:hypothetical protein